MKKQEVTLVNIWMDCPARYGLVSRVLHWGMAYLLIWQFAVILSWRVFDGSDLLKTISSYGPGHGTAGALTIVFVTIRALWAFANRHRRPAHAAGWAGRAALAGHAGLYLADVCRPGTGAAQDLWQRQGAGASGACRSFPPPA